MPKKKKPISNAPELPTTKRKVKVKKQTADKLRALSFLFLTLFGLTLIYLFQNGDLKTPNVHLQLPEQQKHGKALVLNDTYLRQNMQPEAPKLKQIHQGTYVEVLGRDAAWVLVEIENTKGYLPIEALLVE